MDASEEITAKHEFPRIPWKAKRARTVALEVVVILGLFLGGGVAVGLLKHLSHAGDPTPDPTPASCGSCTAR